MEYTTGHEEFGKYLYKPAKGKNVVNPVGEYVLKNSLREKDILRRLREKTAHDLGIHVRMISSPEEAQLFSLLLGLMSAKKAIELGVFTGYNLLSVALALPQDGKVIGCDVSTDYFKVGKEFFEEAGVLHKIDLRIQPAVKTLDDLLIAGEAGTFDFIFIDANKSDYDVYYEKSLQLVRTGGLVAVDNVLWDGRVISDPEKHDADTKVIHQLNEKIHKDTRVQISMLPISDGVTLCRKL